ncbi:CCA tRNA nucleotidyltransferase [Alteribacillus bidgolensis]|uniref:tRNA nucleotidyltransferase (CCA-adding enzyme) n=1 Tax=Alteribacillus bidgolensis TaxID=930129 RepID=A0A1G8C8U1_9BACI|nr:CCA tRNA nucleotidyltransferase [Alteribacillus bidgolensis]SDH41792.1 tRNA nucleotidyltransferase (CCA-adding enzyme) [Alteribacillus bidgolensis]
MDSYWEKAFYLLNKFESQGYSAYIVGGAVRDYHLKRTVHDFDIVTNASPNEIKTLFPKAVQPSKRFPTHIIRWQSIYFEVSPFRLGAKTLQDDLFHRDFTINAIAMDKNQNIIDPLNGISDIDMKIIQASDPIARFKEDPLRMLRGFRFVSELNFTMEEHTLKHVLEQLPALNALPVERIQLEIEKLLKGHWHAAALSCLFFYTIPQFFPQTLQTEVFFLSRSLNMHSLKTTNEKWAAFLWLLYGRKAREKAASWKFSKKDKKNIITMLWFSENYLSRIPWRKHLVYQTGKKLALQIERVHQWIYCYENEDNFILICQLYGSLPITNRKELKLTGKDIIKAFPHIEKEKIGVILGCLEKEVVIGNLNNQFTELVTFVKEKLTNER